MALSFEVSTHFEGISLSLKNRNQETLMKIRIRLLRYLYMRLATNTQSACSEYAQIDLFVQTIASLHYSVLNK